MVKDSTYMPWWNDRRIPTIYSTRTSNVPQETDDDTDIGNSLKAKADDNGAENLDLMLSMLEEHKKLQHEVITLGNTFIEDVQERIKQVDIQYLSGLKKFFTTYLDMVTLTEPTHLATPKLASLLQTSLNRLRSPRK